MSVQGATGSRSFKFNSPCTPKRTLKVQVEMRGGRDEVSSKGTTSNDNVEMTLFYRS